MKRSCRLALVLSFILAMLTPIIAACQNPPPATRAPVSSGHTPAGATPTALPAQERIILHSANLSIVVADPVEALTDLQHAVENAGGYVVSASSWSSGGSASYSSLSAKVPPESLSMLRDAALEIADGVQSDSLYSQNVTSDYRLLHERLRDLTQAQDHVWRLLIQTDDPDLASSFTILRDLLQTERSNVESQLAYYDEQAGFASFDVTLNQPVDFLTPLE